MFLLLLKWKLERDDIYLGEGERGACGVLWPFGDVGGVRCAGLARSNEIQSKIANSAKGKSPSMISLRLGRKEGKICKTP